MKILITTDQIIIIKYNTSYVLIAKNLTKTVKTFIDKL